MFSLTDFLVNNIFKDIFDLMDYASQNYHYQAHTQGIDGKYVSCIKPNTPFNNYTITDRDRMVCKIGKYLTFAYDKLSPAEVTKISETYRSLVDEPKPFKIIEGDDIKWAYWTKNYFEHTGTLSNSCMRYLKCQRENYFQIYSDNAKMLVMTPKRGKRIIGRAILWPYNNTYLMDRVYTTQNYITEQFYNYAKTQGFGILAQNAFVQAGCSQTWLFPDDGYKSKHVIDLKIKLNNNYSTFPFMDSFRYLNADETALSSTPFFGKQFLLQSVYGGKLYYEPSWI